MSRPVAPSDGVTGRFWDATRDERLVVQRCTACGRHQHYPRPVCRSCGSGELDDVESSGRGTVHSFTVVHRSPDPDTFPAPYAVALVDLDEGVRMLTNLVDCDLEDIRCDMRVRVAWLPLDDGRRLPMFTPDGA